MLVSQAHETSVLHVFNAKKKPGLKRVMLPDSNRGMQILRGMGWDEEAGGGLGVMEQGHVQPVKSALKLDRTGLGARQYKVSTCVCVCMLCVCVGVSVCAAVDAHCVTCSVGGLMCVLCLRIAQERVTHFPGHDMEQARRDPKGMSAAQRAIAEVEKRRQEERRGPRVTHAGVAFETKRERRRREGEERKARERIRRQLHMDIPEEYEKYFEDA